MKFFILFAILFSQSCYVSKVYNKDNRERVLNIIASKTNRINSIDSYLQALSKNQLVQSIKQDEDTVVKYTLTIPPNQNLEINRIVRGMISKEDYALSAELKAEKLLLAINKIDGGTDSIYYKKDGIVYKSKFEKSMSWIIFSKYSYKFSKE